MTDKEIREQYKDDKLKDLIPEYRRVRGTAETKKGQRVIALHAVFFVTYLAVFLALIKPDSMQGVVVILFVSALLSCVHFWVNFSLFSWMIKKNLEDSKRYELLEKRLRFAEERDDPINAWLRRGM